MPRGRAAWAGASSLGRCSPFSKAMSAAAQIRCKGAGFGACDMLCTSLPVLYSGPVSCPGFVSIARQAIHSCTVVRCRQGDP